MAGGVEEESAARKNGCDFRTLDAKSAATTDDWDDDCDRSGTQFLDHFSLRIPSSTVTYRGAKVHVYDSANDQFLLEERGAPGEYGVDSDGRKRRDNGERLALTAKRMGRTNFGLRFLRLSYTLVALLLVGFLFVMCFQIVLFLFLNLPVQSGVTSEQSYGDVSGIFGTLLSVPIFLYGMASVMTIGTTFVTDTWSGGILIRSVMGTTAIVTEILYFTLFLVAPSLALIVALIARHSDPWKECAYVWVTSVALAFCVFAVAVVWREIQACFRLISIHRNNGRTGVSTERGYKGLLRSAHGAVLLSQTQRYSGWREERYLVSSGDEKAPKSGYVMSPDHTAAEIRMSLYSHMTMLGCNSMHLGMFSKLDPPVRLYSTEEILDVLPFVTSHNWSLESMCCRHPHSRMIIAAANDDSALKPGQVLSSVLCNIFSSLMIVVIAVGLLIWLNAGAMFSFAAAIACCICCLLPITRGSISLYRNYREINEVFKEDEKDGGAWADGTTMGPPEALNSKEGPKRTMVQVWETFRISEPKRWLCYASVALETAFLFFWPISTLIASRNFPLAIVFFVLGVLCCPPRYFDASALLSEFGSLNDMDVDEAPSELSHLLSLKSDNTTNKENENALLFKSRLSEIVGNISRSNSVYRWMWLFGSLVLLIFLLFLSAVNLDDVSPGERSPIVLLSDFYYPPQPDTLAYPTCEMTKGFKMPGVQSAALGDYAFLAALSYETPNVTQVVLGEWFGRGMVVDESDFVARYRAESGTAQIPIYFKLFSLSSFPGYGIVSIRGSETSWDWLVNMQLWSAAALAQLNKWLIPFGWIWTPLLDELVAFVNFIESGNLRKINYYKVTSQFVRDVLAGYGGSNYHTIRVTGASLGGGLAVITGAQTGANAIAISGLGAELSRHTLEPPVTLQQLNSHVFNVIPQRDIIARVGGRSRLYQEIECTAPSHSLFGCHSMWRSVCEISFRCGSGGRPVLCRCVKKYGYPEPTSNGNRTFSEACTEEENLLREKLRFAQ